jgi:hypothetical protein
MAYDRIELSFVAACVTVFGALTAPGCGSEVSSSGSGAGGGVSTANGTAAGPTTSTTGTNGGNGGAGAATTTSTTTGVGGGSGCKGLFEADCLAHHPECAPIYDDVCCPTCNPGACADCQNFEFYECVPTSEACSGTPTCGITPEWACNGAEPVCPKLDPGGGAYECEATPGCVVAGCSPDVNCNQRECHPVTADSCFATCDIPAPSCPPAFTAEANGFCYTGFCIPAAVCGVF